MFPFSPTASGVLAIVPTKQLQFVPGRNFFRLDENLWQGQTFRSVNRVSVRNIKIKDQDLTIGPKRNYEPQIRNRRCGCVGLQSRAPQFSVCSEAGAEPPGSYLRQLSRYIVAGARVFRGPSAGPRSARSRAPTAASHSLRRCRPGGRSRGADL